MYQWHHGIPVINPFESARVCSILLPIGIEPPTAIASIDDIPEDYNQLIGLYPDNPTCYRLLPEGIDMCFVCEGDGCDHCNHRGYNRAPYAEQE